MVEFQNGDRVSFAGVPFALKSPIAGEGYVDERDYTRHPYRVTDMPGGKLIGWFRQEDLQPVSCTQLQIEAKTLRDAATIMGGRGYTIAARELEAMAVGIETPFDPSPYLSPCPAGFQTVIGWFATQSLETEDMGMRASLWAWRKAVPDAIKVRACEALIVGEVCEWLMAYPHAWLEAHREDLLMRRNGR